MNAPIKVPEKWKRPKDHDLDQIVFRKLDSLRGWWFLISRRSGISYSWITKFMSGHVKNPGILTLRVLRNCLDFPTAQLKRELRRLSTEK